MSQLLKDMEWFYKLDPKSIKIIMGVYNKYPSKVSTKELMEVAGVSRQTVLSKCEDLVARGVLLKSGVKARRHPSWVFTLPIDIKEKIDGRTARPHENKQEKFNLGSLLKLMAQDIVELKESVGKLEDKVDKSYRPGRIRNAKEIIAILDGES